MLHHMYYCCWGCYNVCVWSLRCSIVVAGAATMCVWCQWCSGHCMYYCCRGCYNVCVMLVVLHCMYYCCRGCYNVYVESVVLRGCWYKSNPTHVDVSVLLGWPVVADYVCMCFPNNNPPLRCICVCKQGHATRERRACNSA